MIFEILIFSVLCLYPTSECFTTVGKEMINCFPSCDLALKHESLKASLPCCVRYPYYFLFQAVIDTVCLQSVADSQSSCVQRESSGNWSLSKIG